ncbi:hypothetical protein RR48_01496 [Papilio machaon]|uniref:Uncharacterized protein n=1 Tax=Papilio machaon TaxID=76193 RepID=A0A0N1PGJ1_PAPMA|nr:hypothetical protein RR48_01496 [Papilio machaon]
MHLNSRKGAKERLVSAKTSCDTLAFVIARFQDRPRRDLDITMPEIVQQFPVEKEYEKNKNITAEDIKKLREWLSTQPHLPGEHLSDLDLAIVFHCCDNSSEVSKQVLDLHYTLRTLFTTFFKDRIVDLKLEKVLYNVLIAPLPTPTVHGYRAMYLRLLDSDSRNFNFPVTAKAMMMVFDLWQYQEGTWPGFVLMIDMDQATLGHIAKLDVMNETIELLKTNTQFFKEESLRRVNEALRPGGKKTVEDLFGIQETDYDKGLVFYQVSDEVVEDRAKWRQLISKANPTIRARKGEGKKEREFIVGAVGDYKMKLLPLILNFLFVLLTIVCGMTTMPRGAGLQQGQQAAGCRGGGGGPGGGAGGSGSTPPPPPPTSKSLPLSSEKQHWLDDVTACYQHRLPKRTPNIK